MAPTSKIKEPLIKSSSRVRGYCHTCNKTPQDVGRAGPFQACSKCKEVCYCSVACQRENWPAHKMPCAMSQKRKEILALNPGRAANAARFTKWFERPAKLNVFRQAVLQALDAANHPERVDQKCFHMELELHPDWQKRDPADHYVLKKGTMFPRSDIIDKMSPIERTQLTQYIKVQDDIVKGRGQLGVVPVMMQDSSAKNSMPSWWPLALPCTAKEAKEMLQDTKWGDVYWMSRLRDILAAPESSLVNIDGHIGLPSHLLRPTPMSDTVWVATERFTNDPSMRAEAEGLSGEGNPPPNIPRNIDFDTESCSVM